MDIATLKKFIEKPKHRVFLNDYCTEVCEVIENPDEFGISVGKGEVGLATLRHDSDNDYEVVDIKDLDKLLIVVQELDIKTLKSK